MVERRAGLPGVISWRLRYSSPIGHRPLRQSLGGASVLAWRTLPTRGLKVVALVLIRRGSRVQYKAVDLRSPLKPTSSSFSYPTSNKELTSPTRFGLDDFLFAEAHNVPISPCSSPFSLYASIQLRSNPAPRATNRGSTSSVKASPNISTVTHDALGHAVA